VNLTIHPGAFGGLIELFFHPLLPGWMNEKVTVYCMEHSRPLWFEYQTYQTQTPKASSQRRYNGADSNSPERKGQLKV